MARHHRYELAGLGFTPLMWQFSEPRGPNATPAFAVSCAPWRGGHAAGRLQQEAIYGLSCPVTQRLSFAVSVECSGEYVTGF